MVARAALLVAPAGRTADEDPLAAGGVPRAADVVRAADRDRADGRQAAGIVVVAEAARRQRQPQSLRRAAPLGKRHRHRMLPGLDRHAHEQLRVELLGRLQTAAPVDPADNVGRPHGEALDALPVQPHVDAVLVRQVDAPVAQPLQPAGHDRPLQLDTDAVLPVHRKGVEHADPAARAERQILGHPIVLAEIARRVINRLAGADIRVADRQAADALGGGEVALEERLRHAEHVPDIVEAVARVVGRQELPAVYLDGQQIADRVRILGAVKAVDGRRAARIDARDRRGVQTGRQPAGEPLVCSGIRPRPADRRHLARLQLLQHLLPHLRPIRHVRRVHLLQVQVCGPQALVVTGDAVPIHDRAVVVG